MRSSSPASLVTLLLLIVTVISWIASTNFGPFTLFYLRSFGILFASLGLTMVFLQFLFVSRIRFIEASTGLDRLLQMHRFFGRTGLILLFGHALLIVFYRLTVFGDIYSNAFILLGVVALLGFMVTGALASQHKKIGLAYEIWRNIHLANYILFPLVLIHVFYHSAPGSLLQYLFIFITLIYLAIIIYRLAKIITVRRNPYEIVEVKEEADNIWSLFFKGKTVQHQPGQFMFLQLLRDSRLSSAHPFTISSSPTRDNLSITVKDSGDFTATIGDTKPGDYAYIDAPYGLFSFLNYSCDELVFIAGGIGITPFMSMLRYLYDLKLARKVTLFWSNRSEEELCFKDELEKMQQEMPKLEIHYVITGQPGWAGRSERIDCAFIIEKLGSLADREFFVCGPAEMNKTVIAELKESGVEQNKIHSELFAL